MSSIKSNELSANSSRWSSTSLKAERLKHQRLAMFKLFVTIVVLQIAASNAFKIQSKIVNGVLSRVSDFSFFVKIEDASNICSATLISDRYDFHQHLSYQIHCKSILIFLLAFKLDSYSRPLLGKQ